ncbi:GEVED domain-containing protein [Winogradskyella sp.]|uniref:T9SS type A sorting domain-containing protein n=1 Tax=Winogradskyella sp. TaxID=1883156 RepID=UPI001B2C32E6|nr:GEVED domain-containing protein [Winogradskyella sp.]MBO6879324.1 zinc-dependent metalloprotease [Winogradskyella sp.]
MKNFTLCVLLGLLLAAVPFNSHAQDRCGMEEYMEEMMKDPEYARQYEEKQKALKQRLQNYLNNSDLYQRGGTIEIPVAVHFPEASEAERSCLEALAQNQIDILNADYTATNSDISSWNAISSQYPGTSAGVANISFCIATSNHPTGLDPELLEGNPCITIGYNFGGGSNTDGNWSGYLNFVIRNIGALGFSPLFGDISDGDAVTMDNNAFGSGAGCTSVVPGAPYNLGRTTTHELGHFFGLNHTFNADGGGTCGSGGDGIADTPEVANSTYGCPNPPTSVPSCTPGQPALTMNYMDYVNDACMYMFSQDQMTFAEAYISSIQADIKPNVCQPASPGFNLIADPQEIVTCPNNDTEAVYMFSYNTIQGFSETTNFSVSGVPPGVSSDLSPTTLNSDGTVTLTLSNISSLANNTYTMTLTGTSSSVTEQASVDLTITSSLCPSEGDLSFQTRVTGVNFNTINNSSPGAKTAPYSDFTSQSTDVEAGQNYDLTVNINTDGNFLVITRVWIDWNQNCSFDDPGEEYDMGDTANVVDQPTTSSPLTVSVPTDAASGTTIMRVSAKYSPPTGNDFPTSCEIGFDGEVEDYTLNVMNNLSIDESIIDNLSVYPNPNNGTFNIGFSPKSGEDITIQVYDIRGRAIFENTYNSVGRFDEVIQLTNAESGVYLLNISDGPQKVTKKIVVD